jgi:HlyD family secretion protein
MGKFVKNHSFKITSAVGLVCTTLAFLLFGQTEKSDASVKTDQPPRTVAALGRISPKNGVFQVTMPASSYPGFSPVAELHVKEGDLVKKGQLLAVLENKQRLETTWKSALAQGDIAGKRVEQIRSGAHPTELAASEAEAQRLETELASARTRHARNEKLFKTGAIPAAAFESTETEVAISEKGLEAARQRYRRLALVREVDLAVAEAQHQAALAEAEHAKAESGQAFIHAPCDGKVLKIYAHPGEAIGSSGLLELAEMPLYVLAEVYEPDIVRIKPGQKAEITGSIIDGKMTGVVEEIGYRVGRNRLFGSDPASATDLRIVEVKIRPERSAPVWIDARVTVQILP